MEPTNITDFQRRRSLLENHVGFKLEAILHQALKARDTYTQEHSSRVIQLAEMIGETLGLSDHEMTVLSLAASFHDIGKIGIPDHILLKPGILTLQEHDIIKTHTTIGANILRSLGDTLLDEVAECVLRHHEHWNGRGYPDGLAGREIPKVSRVIAVVDAFDAMTSTRAYRHSLAKTQTLETILAASNTQFCPDVVEVLENIVSASESLNAPTRTSICASPTQR